MVEVVFENQAAYDADRAAAIHLRVPVGDGLYGKCVFHSGQDENKNRVPTEQPLPLLPAAKGVKT